MASRTKKRGSSALDSLMAGFSAGAAAFIVYAMPQARFDEAIALSGLPMILPAAQPPLGMTARFGVMAAAGIGSFLLVWLVLRALGKPAQRRRDRDLEEIKMAPPRLRRADMHPDAPSRRPLLAGAELGQSFDELPTDEEQPEEEPEMQDDELLAEGRPLYDRSIYGQLPAEELLNSYEPESHEEAGEEPLSVSEEPFAATPGHKEDEAEPHFAPDFYKHDAEPDPVPFFAGRCDEADEPAAARPAASLADEDHGEEELEEEYPLDLSPRQVETVEALTDRLPRPENGQDSIPELMRRLEAGLMRRRPSRWMPVVEERPNGTSTVPGAAHLDIRLRGAVDELQKLAARGN